MAEFKDLLQSVGSGLTGSIHKAILCVRKPSEGGMPSFGETSNIDLRAKLAANSGSFLNFTNTKAVAAAGGFHAMQVKYNPNTIHFSTQAGSYMETGAGGTGVNQITQITLPSQTTMTVELVFDDVNNLDAFQWEKFSLSFGSSISAVSGVVKQIKKDGYSVQTQVEGLVALITSPAARQAVFYWRELAFAGEITNVNATYTMFNPQGNPIRATVRLSIRQSDTDESGEDTTYWDEAFTKLFGKPGENGEYKDSGVIDQIGNLIQF